MKNEKPIYILDATPLIRFAKINKLKLIPKICEAYITKEVYRETVERGKRCPDSVIISDAIEDKELKIYDVREKKLVSALLRHPEIHLGEAETLVAAKELGGTAIIDEKETRVLAKLYGVKTGGGTLFLLFRLLARGLIDANQCKKTLDELIATGLYLDPATLLNAERKLQEHREGEN